MFTELTVLHEGTVNTFDQTEASLRFHSLIISPKMKDPNNYSKLKK